MIARKRWPALKKEETRKLWRVWKRSRWEFRIVISSSFIASSVLQTVCLCLLLFSFFFLCDYLGFYHPVEMQCNRGEYAAFPMTSPKDQMSKSYRWRTTTTVIGLGVVRKILATFIPHILNHLHPTSSPNPGFIRIMTDIILFSQISMLNKFSEMIRGNLTKIQRQKIVALVTIEVHARDVIEKMIKSGCGDVTAFEWLSQLRLYWDKVCRKLYDTDCFIYN